MVIIAIGWKICLQEPIERRNVLLEAYHTNNGHRGVDATEAAIRQNYFWSDLQKDVRNFIRNCERCQRAKPRIGKSPG